MNIGYYKLAKYMGVKCHNDLSFFFSNRLKEWTYKAAHSVADLYIQTEDEWRLKIGCKTYSVIETDKRRRIPITVNGITDKLSAQVDQVISHHGKKYLLDWKFTKCNDELERIIDEARQQIAYYAWILDDPDVIGGAYIIASLTTKEVLAIGTFDFEQHEPARALMRRLTELPGYENLNYSDIRRSA